nr:hypothetical protein [Bosea vaviloviae]
MALETTRFDIQDHLKTQSEQTAYLEAALAEDDPSFIAIALGDIARAASPNSPRKPASAARRSTRHSAQAGIRVCRH